MIACRPELAPPFCCQPPLTDEEWAARTARIALAGKAAYERIPERCPSCDDDSVFPVFDPEGRFWECGRCGNVWEATGGR